MYGVIDVEKSQQEGKPVYLFFIAHPPKCAGTKLVSEIRKHKHVGIHTLVNESTHTTPSHIINTQPVLWSQWGHLPIYCITRHPYERFESQMGFVPIVLSKFGPRNFFGVDYGEGLFSSQWEHMTHHNMRLDNLIQIKLEDVTGTVFEIEGLEIDMRESQWTQQDAYESIDITGFPQYKNNHSKEFVQDAFPNDFENLGYHK